MILERSEVEVIPSEFRLFDHLFVELLLETGDKEALPRDVRSKNALWRARLLMGPVRQNKMDVSVDVVTEEFRLGDTPLFREAIGFWGRVHENNGKMEFGHALLLCLHHVASSVLSVQFYFVDGEMETFAVNLGGMVVKGNLPKGFDMSHYFGETNKLED